MWKAVRGPDIATSVRDFGCPPGDDDEEELDGEGLEAAVQCISVCKAVTAVL